MGTIADLLSTAMRDFQRYTGDGLPNEPAGRPLPVGDPASGQFNPPKKQVRDAFLAIAETADDLTEAVEAAAGLAGLSEQSAINSATQAGIATSQAGVATTAASEATLAAIAAGANLVSSLSDPLPADGSIELLQTGAGTQIHEVQTGTWVQIGWLGIPVFPTIAAAKEASGFIDGQSFDVKSGENGQIERFTARLSGADAMLTANGKLVLDAEGMGDNPATRGRLISSRTLYADFAELKGDPRSTLSATTSSVKEGGFSYKVMAADTEVFDKITNPEGYHIITSGGLKYRLNWPLGFIFAKSLGAAEDGVVSDAGEVSPGATDDTVAVQLAADILSAGPGGKLLLSGKSRIGNVVVTGQRVVLEGQGTSTGFIVKNGTLGVSIEGNYSYATRMMFWSEGNLSDGLNTRGIFYKKGVGHSNQQFVDFRGFSGIPFEAHNMIHSNMDGSLFILCAKGPRITRGGTTGGDFSTTVNITNWYTLNCGDGGFIEYLYESYVDIIVENCAAPLLIRYSRFEMKPWLEGNMADGVTCQDAFVFTKDVYQRDGNNDIVRLWDGGVTPAASRGYRDISGMDFTGKGFALLAGFGVDPKFFRAHGTTDNIGAKYGESTVALIRGDNLAAPAAWVSETTSEFVGYDVVVGGYKISSALTGARGMRQTITLDNAKTYIIDTDILVTSGVAATSWIIKVGADTITSGKPFTPTADGAQVVKIYAVQSGTHLAHIPAFSLAEMVADTGQIAQATDRLTSHRPQRGLPPMSAPPVTGVYAVGEIVPNSNPSIGDPSGWIRCVGGVWGKLPAIEAI